MTTNKTYANKGLKRNKKPLRSIVYKIELAKLKPHIDTEQYENYKFKDIGYLVLYWWYEGKREINYHGFVTIPVLKSLIGEKQYAKFCTGKRVFIIQRRINGKNISKENQC